MRICFSTKMDPNYRGRGGGGYRFESMLSTYLANKGYAITHDINSDYDVLLFIQATRTCTTIRDVIAPKKAKGLKVIHRVDGYPVPKVKHGDFIMKAVNSIADITVFQSQYSKKIAGQVLKGRNTIVYNGIDTNLFNPEGTKIYNAQDKYPIFLYGKWARGKPQKGFDNLLAQWPKIKKAYPKALLRLAGRYGDHVIKKGIYNYPDIHYCGILDHKQLSIEMRSADVILFPSVNDWCSMFCLESMASGTPLVYHPSGGTTEIVNNTGFPIRNNDLLPAIKGALGNSKLANAARDRIVKNFTKEIMCEKYLKVILEIS